MPITDEASFNLFDEDGTNILDEGTVSPTILSWSGKLIGTGCHSV